MIEGFGLALVDILLNVPKKIVLNHKHVVSDQIFQIGGVIPTALIFLSGLGTTCRFHTTLADDNFGTMIKQFLNGSKINLNVIKKEGNSPCAAVAVEQPTGNRTGFYNLGVFAGLSKKDLKTLNFQPGTKFLLLDAHNLVCSKALIDKAKKNHLTTFLDLGTYKKGALDLIKAADVIFIPEAFRQAVFPRLKPDLVALKLQKLGPRIVVVTQGEQGCFVASQGKVFHQPAYKVKAVDTNGAGDVFMGGFVYGLIKDWSLKKTAQFAAAAAALTCTKLGKIESIPKSESAVLNLINSR